MSLLNKNKTRTPAQVDVQDVVKDTLGHRVKLGQKARAQGMNMDAAMKALIQSVRTPRM